MAKPPSAAVRTVKRHLPALLALAALNAWICRRLFTLDYINEFASIDGAFVSIASYLSRHWSGHSWWPLWHCGMPFEDTYVPLLHQIVAMVATVGRIPAVRAYHMTVGLTYSLGPVTLYAMAVYLGAERGSAFLSALMYSLFSPCALFLPAVARDMGGMVFSRRLQVLTVYGEGPHVSVMTLLPIAIVALEYGLRKRSGRAFVFAAVMLAAVFLTNVPGTMATGLAVFCWLAVQPAGRRRAAWIVAGSAAILAYALACYGIPPSSELTVLGNIGRMHKGFSTAAGWVPVLLSALLAAIALAGALLSRTRLPLVLRFGAVYFALTAVLVLTVTKDKFELLPQVIRFQLEMEMGFCLMAGALGWFLYRRSPWRLQMVLGLLLAIGVGYQTQHYLESANRYIGPVDLAARSEHASAVWADAHLSGQRVYVSGSDSFWWNAFTDVPQVLGCCDQGFSSPAMANIVYLIDPATGPYHEILTRGYLQALGAQAIVVSGPQSTDEYKDILGPERFDAMFPILHRELGDTIYAVPQRSTSLAHVVKAGETVPIPATVYKVYDYSLAIEDPARPAADFEWLGDGAARIRATLSKADLISVQVPWFSGWKAWVGKRRIPISPDGLGFQVLHPEVEGPAEIKLEWTGSPDRVPSEIVSLATLIFLICVYLRSSVRKLA